MYKYLLCWRYLQTRYLALACIISVMLGVATLIVVNSVMSGFSTKLKDRLHALLSDIVIESNDMDGFDDPSEKMRRIRNDPFLKERVEAMAATMEVFAMVTFHVRGQPINRVVRLIGVDAESRSQVGGFAEHLVHQKNANPPSFEPSDEVKALNRLKFKPFQPPPAVSSKGLPNEPPAPEPLVTPLKVPTGIILGNAIATYRDRNAHANTEVKDIPLVELGDEITVVTVSGQQMRPVDDLFVVCDYFKSEMSEYDNQYVFVSLEHLQKLRTMENRATCLQIKLKDYSEAKHVVDALDQLFPSSVYHVQTWEDKQGPLLQAIRIEKGILNVLLFLIVGVAGFGILAIFTMIVVEKTRDIGILKALGASNAGVMRIFMGYSLLLGLLGAGLGTVMGMAITNNINAIEKLLGRLTGQDIFPRDIYYFDKIPTDIQFWSVVGINLGAIAIAVVFSVLPSLRAALLHPVRALRYE